MLARSTAETDSVGGSADGLAACAHRPHRRVGRLAVALSVLVAALLLAATERHADSAAIPVPPVLPIPPGAVADVPAADDAAASLGGRALALVDWDVDGLGYAIEFRGERTNLRALTFPYEKRIEVYVREDDDLTKLAHVVAHEIGHAIDVEHNSADDRRQWLLSRGLDADYPWWPVSAKTDFATGAGDFAECFATWRVGDRSYTQIPGTCDQDLLQTLAR